MHVRTIQYYLYELWLRESVCLPTIRMQYIIVRKLKMRLGVSRIIWSVKNRSNLIFLVRFSFRLFRHEFIINNVGVRKFGCLRNIFTDPKLSMKIINNCHILFYELYLFIINCRKSLYCTNSLMQLPSACTISRKYDLCFSLLITLYIYIFIYTYIHLHILIIKLERKSLTLIHFIKIIFSIIILI